MLAKEISQGASWAWEINESPIVRDFLEPHTITTLRGFLSPPNTQWSEGSHILNINDAGHHTRTRVVEYGSYGESHLVRLEWQLFTMRRGH